jgi:single-strand DNA-binding protein
MSGSVNKVILVGNVGQDPKINVTRNGKKMARFSVATSKRWRDESGERMESTTWHNVVVFNDNMAAEVERTIGKGSRVYVEGELNNRKWNDDGVEKWMTEIIVSNLSHRAEAVDQMAGNIHGTARQAPPPDDLSSYGNSRPVAARSSGVRNDEVPFMCEWR